MQREEIMPRLQTVFRDIFENPDLVITEQTYSGDIMDWDSLANVRLMIAVESEFGCEFGVEEIEALKNVGDLVSLVASKKT